ncbi:MAG: hypothetical protein HN726_01845 [Candidatus Magasanikbacteria bacterium]|jgi:hypothetical protein|nr:hypothetical protein [Candidatus Magasanikbacteria bacterium]MBT4221486.1 hypothetical protein [Candidatus Magasanikbacteria bacterium]MBT4350856.1 hypothetical protein [Candidatus Magasanikbacteria bacterium]MBT4541865.1 hypothetical protein [Candidatus Magasanikbacteria bacterium]MBT6253103.1 hypothetical protein [Candidatus Magasanikbacteria bacterium]
MKTFSIKFSISKSNTSRLDTLITPGYETISSILYDLDGHGEILLRLQKYLNQTDTYNLEHEFIGTDMSAIETKKDENGEFLFDLSIPLFGYEYGDPGHCYISRSLLRYMVDTYISERAKFKSSPVAYAANLEETNKKYSNITI